MGAMEAGRPVRGLLGEKWYLNKADYRGILEAMWFYRLMQQGGKRKADSVERSVI